MASARATYRWADGGELDCEVRVSASYPDAIDEAKTQTLALLREGMAVLMAYEGDE